MSTISVRDLTKRFVKGGGLKDFELRVPELSIRENEIVYLVGPNGSGKTTLLSLFQGLIAPDRGSILIHTDACQDGIDILGLQPHERANLLSVVPQDCDEALVNEMPIADHVLVGLGKAGKLPWLFPRNRCRSMANELLMQFEMGFEDRLDEPVGNLSGGERQVLAFCLATISSPEILLLDEFTGALDPEMASRVLGIVISVIRSNQLSALIVTHRHREALDNADRIVILHRGKLQGEVERGDDDFTEASLKELFANLYQSR